MEDGKHHYHVLSYIIATLAPYQKAKINTSSPSEDLGLNSVASTKSIAKQAAVGKIKSRHLLGSPFFSVLKLEI